MAKTRIKKTLENSSLLTIDCSRIEIGECGCFINLNQKEFYFFQNRCHAKDEKFPICLSLRFRVAPSINQIVEGYLNDETSLCLDFDSKSRDYLKQVSKIKGSKITLLHHQFSQFYSTVNLPNSISISNEKGSQKVSEKKERVILFTLSRDSLINECVTDSFGKYSGLVLFAIPDSIIAEVIDKCRYALHALSYSIRFNKKAGKAQIYKNSISNGWVFSCNLAMAGVKPEFLSQIMESSSCYVELSHPNESKYIQITVVNPDIKEKMVVHKSPKGKSRGASARHYGTPGKGIKLPTAAYLDRPRNYDGSRPSLDRLT